MGKKWRFLKRKKIWAILWMKLCLFVSLSFIIVRYIKWITFALGKHTFYSHFFELFYTDYFLNLFDSRCSVNWVLKIANHWALIMTFIQTNFFIFKTVSGWGSEEERGAERKQPNSTTVYIKPRILHGTVINSKWNRGIFGFFRIFETPSSLHNIVIAFSHMNSTRWFSEGIIGLQHVDYLPTLGKLISVPYFDYQGFYNISATPLNHDTRIAAVWVRKHITFAAQVR